MGECKISTWGHFTLHSTSKSNLSNKSYIYRLHCTCLYMFAPFLQCALSGATQKDQTSGLIYKPGCCPDRCGRVDRPTNRGTRVLSVSAKGSTHRIWVGLVDARGVFHPSLGSPRHSKRLFELHFDGNGWSDWSCFIQALGVQDIPKIVRTELLASSMEARVLSMEPIGGAPTSHLRALDGTFHTTQLHVTGLLGQVFPVFLVAPWMAPNCVCVTRLGPRFGDLRLQASLLLSLLVVNFRICF